LVSTAKPLNPISDLFKIIIEVSFMNLRFLYLITICSVLLSIISTAKADEIVDEHFVASYASGQTLFQTITGDFIYDSTNQTATLIDTSLPYSSFEIGTTGIVASVSLPNGGAPGGIEWFTYPAFSSGSFSSLEILGYPFPVAGETINGYLGGASLAAYTQGGSENVYVSITGTSPVPILPAVWLFGSALVGLIGINRKKLV
jgi:hypothetical protein